MKSLRRFARDDRAQSFLEIAVALPFFALMLVGTFEFGRYAYAKIELGNAARAAVQYGAQGLATSGDYPGMKSAAIADGNELGLVAGDVTASQYRACDKDPTTPAASCTNDRLDYFVRVTVTHAYVPLFSYPGLQGPIAMTRTETQEVSP